MYKGYSINSNTNFNCQQKHHKDKQRKQQTKREDHSQSQCFFTAYVVLYDVSM